MATKELRELRHRYKSAYTQYMSCVQALSDASTRGEWPPTDMVQREHATFAELAFVRHELLQKLKEHTAPRDSH